MTTIEKIADKAAVNPFLVANFAPVSAENVITNLTVSGAIPEELEGRFLRIGPNPTGKINAKQYHWFMGTGMVHGVRLKGGKAEWYRNNYVLTDNAARDLKRKQLAYPRKTHGGSVNTNVLSIGGDLYALVEAGALPMKLDGNLQTTAYSDFDGTLKGAFSAHPRRDPLAGELHILAYEPMKKHIDYLVVDKAGHSRTAAQIAAPHQPMIHDTAITPSFVVVLDLPMTFDVVTAMSGKFPYVWNRKHEPRIGLLPRNGDVGSLTWFEAPQCYVYHIMNAFEDGEKVVVDVIKNSTYFDASAAKREIKQFNLVRWNLDLSTGQLTETQLAEQCVEFPRLNDSFIGQNYRFGYTAQFTADLKFGSAYKHDLISGETIEHSFGEGRATMEPVFVAKANAKSEDEGWLLSYVYDQNTDRTDVVILDAQDFSGAPVATIHLPVRVPFGFHGNWVADGDLNSP
ncbi:carotenoid oxygenase family protein [soil metagenome]